jgi:putative phosphoesterase
MADLLDRFLPPDLPPARVAARIGIISDTHMPDRCAALPPALFEALRGADLLLHAGDVGELWVLDRLSAVAPVIAVHGNDETAAAQQELPYQQLIVVAGQRILLTHAHYPDQAAELESRRDDAWGPKLAHRAAFGRRAGASIVVFGHTHIPMAHWYDGLLLVNPGAIASSSPTTRQLRQTVALLFIRYDGAPFVAHIDLAAPERPFVPQIGWDAGFCAALDQYSESILAPDLAAEFEHVKSIIRLAPNQGWAAVLRAAHPCWAGERVAITRADLLAEIRGDPTISATVQVQFVAALERRADS